MMQSNNDDTLDLNSLRVEVLYGNSVIPIAVTIVGCTTLLYLLWDNRIAYGAIAWISLLFIILAIRCLIVMRYHDSSKKPEDHVHWLNLFFIGTLCSGSVLGSTAYVFIIEYDLLKISLLMMFMLVLISGSIGIYSVFQRVYYGFAIPTIAPLAIYLLSQRNEILNKLCLILIAFVFFIFVIQFHSHKIIKQLLTIKLDNDILLKNYELDHDRINILERMFKTCEVRLKSTQDELKKCKESLAEK